jgi:hypothetical protein
MLPLVVVIGLTAGSLYVAYVIATCAKARLQDVEC